MGISQTVIIGIFRLYFLSVMKAYWKEGLAHEQAAGIYVNQTQPALRMSPSAEATAYAN